MRKLHRWIAPLAALFLTVVAATGVWLQGEALWHRYHPEPETVRRSLPANALPEWLSTTIGAARRVDPQGKIAMISFRMDGDRPRADLMWTAPEEPGLTLDPQTGERFQPASSQVSDQPVSRRLTRTMLRFHRGDLLGLPGRWLGLACGLALFTLGLTGLSVYLKIYRQRLKLRRFSLFW